MKINKESIKKILIIKLKGIGDVILSTPILKNIKHNFPGSQIDFLTLKPSDALLKGLNEIDNVLLFNKGSLFERIKQIIELRKEKYDLVIDAYANPATAILTFFSGAKYRLGFPYKGRSYAYNIYGPPERDKYHSGDLHLKLIESLNIEIISSELNCFIPQEDLEWAKEFITDNLGNSKPLIGLSPSGGWASKKMPYAEFIRFAKTIDNIYDVNFVVLWGPGDKQDAEKIHSGIKNSILIPQTNITQMAAFLKNCDLVIANDSGPMHISAAVNTPTLSIHGPTSPLFQGPYGSKHSYLRKDSLDCIECNLLDCPKNQECFRTITDDEFLNSFNELINKNGIKLVKKA